MRWLEQVGGVLAAPRRTFASLIENPPGFWYFFRLMALFWVATQPLAIVRVLLASDRGGYYLFQRLVMALVDFAALPLFFCTGFGLAVAGYIRLRRRAAALDLLVPAALFVWIPTGLMGLIGQALLAAGVFVPYLPHVPLGWFLANRSSVLDIILRLVLSYGWSLALAWVFVRAAMKVPGADRPAFLSPRKAGGLLAGVWALSLGAGIFGAARHYDDLRPLSRSDPAPAVLGVDLADGRRVAPADFADKPVVVQFWATWCPVCVHSMPELIEWARLHPRVKVLAVHVGAPRQEVLDFVREKGWKGIGFLADESGEAASAWRVDSYPTVVTLGRGGRIAGIRIGEASGDWLDAHLSAEPPPPQVEYSR